MIKVKDALICVFIILEKEQQKGKKSFKLHEVTELLSNENFKKNLISLIERKNKKLLIYLLNEFSYLYEDKELNFNEKKTLGLLILYSLYKVIRNPNRESLDFLLYDDTKKIKSLKNETKLYL